MKKDLAVVKTQELVVEDANRRIAVELVPMAVELLSDMLESETRNKKSRDPSVPNTETRNKKSRVPNSDMLKSTDLVNYGRFHLELVKLTFASAGIGAKQASDRKDIGRMTAQQIMAELDKARIIEHEPAKPLKVLD